MDNRNVVRGFSFAIKGRRNKMRCKEARRLLSAFIDGELAPEVTTEMEKHLKNCASCMQEKESILASLNLIDESVPVIEPSPYFWTKLKHQILQREEKKSLKTRIFGWLAYKPATVAAIAAVVVGLFLGNFLGKALYYGEETTHETAYAEALNLGALDDFPSGSIGEAYLELITQGR